jgi:hypothetical protein
MIEDEKQYKITKNAEYTFSNKLKELQDLYPNTTNILIKAQIDALGSMRDSLTKQIKEYENEQKMD